MLNTKLRKGTLLEEHLLFKAYRGATGKIINAADLTRVRIQSKLFVLEAKFQLRPFPKPDIYIYILNYKYLIFIFERFLSVFHLPHIQF